jgi:acetoacetyl-CoA synthetase
MPRVREARADDFSKVYPLLLGFGNEGLAEEDWRQLFVDHTGLQDGKFGWVLVEGDEVVGFLGTIMSQRTVRGEKVRLCNTSSWIVKPEYRAHSLALQARVLADRAVTVTSLSPTPEVAKVLERMGFKLIDKSERIIFPVLTPLGLARGCEVVTDPAALERALDGERLRYFRDHQLPFHRHALVRSKEGDCYLMMNRSPKAVARGLRLPFARIHHVDAPAVLARHSERVATILAARVRVVGMIVDNRLLGQHVPWNSFERPSGPQNAAFRSDRLTEQDIDGLYTEAVLLNF